ncbi:hypothetical protein POVWA1_061900 [Plasmodium ovale wallikeri]|nr:hypothetical protein POVWA1_061900 [Plasmodium ovale wallikeri]SBT82832.1 conserved Plasmodium protein, unknown function [Plasmodium ovale]
MKRERNKPLNESKGRKKRNDEKAIGTENNEKNGDAFNPQLSARELKKIQYYENMFKKMEKQKEENYNEVDSKIKRKSSNSRKTKKEGEADKKDENKADNTNGKEVCRKEENEDENKNAYANANTNARANEKGNDFKSREFLLKNVGPISGQDFTGKDIMRRERDLVTDVATSSSMDNRSIIEQKRKEKKELLEVKKKNVIKELPNAGIFGRREISNKKKNGLHYNLFSSDESENETRKLNDTDKISPNNGSLFCCNSRHIFNNRSDRELNDGIRNGRSNHTMVDIRKEKMKKAQEKEITKEMAKERGLGTNTKMQTKLDKGHESDSTVNYNNPMHYVNFQMYNNQRRRKGKMMLKVKRSFSADSSINEYYLDADSVHLKSTYDSSTSGNEYVQSNKYHSHTSQNKKRDVLNLQTSDIEGEKSINMQNKWQENGELKNEICYFGRSTQNSKNNNWNYQNSYTKSFIESKDSFDLYLNDKEYIDENMNTKSNSTEYFNDEIVTNKKLFSSKNFNHKSSSESNRTNCVNKKYDVNFCIRKYLNRMRHTNLKKLKKVNKANVNLYVKSCTNFLNFNKFDSAILSLRKFQNTLQREEERIAMDSSKGM